MPKNYLCESGSGCEHIIPDLTYGVLNEWCNRNAGIYGSLRIVHRDCAGQQTILEQRGEFVVTSEKGDSHA